MKDAATPRDRMIVVFRRVLTRPPSADELDTLLAFHEAQRKRLDAGQLNAAHIADDKNAGTDLAAWVMTARAVMNLDEAITKP